MRETVSTPAIEVFVPGLLELHIYGKDFDPEWDLIFPGCGVTSTLPNGKHFAVHWLYEPRSNQQSVNEDGVSIPCGAVSTREIIAFVPGLLDLYVYRRISDPGM